MGCQGLAEALFPRSAGHGGQPGLLPGQGHIRIWWPQPAEGTVQPAWSVLSSSSSSSPIPIPSLACPAQPASLPPFLFLSSVLLFRSSLDTAFTLISANFGIAPKKYTYILGKKKKGEKS